MFWSSVPTSSGRYLWPSQIQVIWCCMYSEIIAVYSDSLKKLTNNVQEETPERLLPKLLLRIQSAELYLNFCWIQQTISRRIFINMMLQLAEKFCSFLGTEKILNLCAVLRIWSLSRVACIQFALPGAIPLLSLSINLPTTPWFSK